MKHCISILVLSACLLGSAQAQLLPGSAPKESLPSVVSMQSATPAYAGDGTEAPVLRTHTDRSSLLTGASMSGMGAGVRSTYTREGTGRWSTQISTGTLFYRSDAQSNLLGMNSAAAVIPVMYGARYEFGRIRNDSFSWSQYAVAGAGPLLGIQYPMFMGFWETLSSLGLRWGGGAYAGIGTEMRVSGGWSGFMQVELDGFGFTAPLAGRSSYLGPSFSLGFQFAVR
jgi:hypothetical protein